MTKEIRKKDDTNSFIDVVCGKCGKMQMSIDYPKIMSDEQVRKELKIDPKDWALGKTKITCVCECGNKSVIMI